MSNKTKLIIASASVISAALFSTQLTAHASTGPLKVEYNLTTTSLNVAAEPVLVAWSIKSAAKKTYKKAKSTAKGVKAIGKHANKTIVPSEVRNGASKISKVPRKAYKKVFRPVTVKNSHDHRTKTKIVTHDHRTKRVTVKRR